ncbi:MAG: hypothetical protein IPK53_17545 [bacterium]|nr:hypothetical protein [bacterium]
MLISTMIIESADALMNLSTSRSPDRAAGRGAVAIARAHRAQYFAGLVAARALPHFRDVADPRSQDVCVTNFSSFGPGFQLAMRTWRFAARKSPGPRAVGVHIN